MATEKVDNSQAAERQILMPIDPSVHCQRAYDWYSRQIRRDGDMLQLVHIIEPSSSAFSLGGGGGSQSGPGVDEFNSQLVQQVSRAKVLGQQFIDRAHADGVKVKFTLHLGYKPGDHICRMARECGVEMIVLGNRGLGTVRRTILGSVSDHVLHHAHLPVVLVPPNKDK